MAGAQSKPSRCFVLLPRYLIGLSGPCPAGGVRTLPRARIYAPRARRPLSPSYRHDLELGAARPGTPPTPVPSSIHPSLVPRPLLQFALAHSCSHSFSFVVPRRPPQPTGVQVCKRAMCVFVLRSSHDLSLAMLPCTKLQWHMDCSSTLNVNADSLEFSVPAATCRHS
ncbi:hypothetical protein L226DRAFT_222595 [Lentinus tigrinus ALCF2SS1-7]|uniref:uncharacterized protein n=1 Tax=Lentinus tigrinus ALCF2SS1-7 TaxID=1328758 RepID=UPI001165EE1A|nr:hypothetical protein L226DRAFT_222595 [Lentinus tigrinus ALCF2SS1-7]